jgi:hypothetical protein
MDYAMPTDSWIQVITSLGVLPAIVFWLLFRQDTRMEKLQDTLTKHLEVQTRIVTMLEGRRHE